MRRSVAALALLLVACSSSHAAGPTATTSSSTTSTTTTTTTTTTSGTGGGTNSITTTHVGGSGAEDTCNPVTNEGCAPGEACDLSASKHVFRCFPPPNTKLPCEACGQNDGWCAPRLTCYGGNCARYCCGDPDCGPAGKCDKSLLADTSNGEVGLCFEAAAGGGAPAPVCLELPLSPPSAGACAVFQAGTGGAGGINTASAW